MWDPDTLARAESSLAKSMGPLAGLLVRRAARTSSDLPSLYAHLAEQLTDPAARQAFLAQAGAPAAASAPPTTHTAQPSAPGMAASGEPPSQALIEQSVRLLALRIGPIAKVVVKKAAAGEVHREDFLAALAMAVSDRAARDKLLDELSKIR